MKQCSSAPVWTVNVSDFRATTYSGEVTQRVVSCSLGGTKTTTHYSFGVELKKNIHDLSIPWVTFIFFLDYWIIMYANISGSVVIRLRKACTGAHILIRAGVVLTKYISPHPNSPFCCTSVWILVGEANSGYCLPRKKKKTKNENILQCCRRSRFSSCSGLY